jgi:hypothetical protein
MSGRAPPHGSGSSRICPYQSAVRRRLTLTQSRPPRRMAAVCGFGDDILERGQHCPARVGSYQPLASGRDAQVRVAAGSARLDVDQRGQVRTPVCGYIRAGPLTGNGLDSTLRFQGGRARTNAVGRRRRPRSPASSAAIDGGESSAEAFGIAAGAGTITSPMLIPGRGWRRPSAMGRTPACARATLALRGDRPRCPQRALRAVRR